MERYVCVHGHFYQPPRENPWLEAIEEQPSAGPFHDWNERITAECYGPNSRSRILNERGRIWKIVNNYASISFNFGPTLLSWMQVKAPEVYAAILEADRLSRERFGGHGNALAQAYNHTIVPLCNDRDKRTQVIWGLADFEHRFQRKAEGMWLPEAAVDTPTLEHLAEHGVKFAVLAPRQAARVRGAADKRWKNVAGGRIDPSRAYLQHLPSGRSIALFFYDGPVSQAVAFEGLLYKGEYLAGRLVSAFDDSRTWPQLVHIATDGESYGHHHRQGDMALAYAVHHIQASGAATLINYGQFLERHPPADEVKIVENSSWSCAHGVERWKSDCGCNSGRAGWNQAWRAPLRIALDWLRDSLAPRFEQAAGELFSSPWQARDAYIGVVLDRSPQSLERFFSDHAPRPLGESERVRAMKLLEMQRHLMLMYTSCGWFFDELSGIETVQVIQYAGRAVQLAEELFGPGVEEPFLQRLEAAPSNIAQHGNGRRIYQRMVKPATVDLRKVAAHAAMSSLFISNGELRAGAERREYAFDVQHEQRRDLSTGQARFAGGIMRVASRITLEWQRFAYAVLHLGGHVVNANAGAMDGDEGVAGMLDEAEQAFTRADFPELVRVIDRHFKAPAFTLGTVFADERRRILDRVLESTMAEVEADYRRNYHHHAPLLQFLVENGSAVPRWLSWPAEFVVNADLRRAVAAQPPEFDAARTLLQQSQQRSIVLDQDRIAFELANALERYARALKVSADDLAIIRAFDGLATLAAAVPFDVDLSQPQNIYYELLQAQMPQARRRLAGGDDAAGQWLEEFVALGAKLNMEVPAANEG